MIEMQMTETFIYIHKAYLAIIIKSENKVYRPLWARDSQGEPPFSPGHLRDKWCNGITNIVETQKSIYFQ